MEAVWLILQQKKKQKVLNVLVQNNDITVAVYFNHQMVKNQC